MNFDELQNAEKALSSKPIGHINIKDADLQIQDPSEADRAQFKNIYSYYLYTTSKAQQSTTSSLHPESIQVQLAYSEFEAAFATLMDISKEIKGVYHKIKDAG